MIELKTLLEKARPELIAGIEKTIVKYPSLGEAIKKALSELYFVNLMTISTWVDVRAIWFEETGELSNHPWDLFQKD